MFCFQYLKNYATIKFMRINSFIFTCLVLVLTGCGLITSKQSEPQPPQITINPIEILRSDIDNVLQDDLFTTASIGIKVVSVDSGEVIYSKNANKLHHPASTTKLFTAAAALVKLGQDCQFETTLYTDKVTDGKVVGNIYLKGSADPVLQSNDIINLADSIVQSGITSIEGNLVVDESYFDTVREGPGWMWDDRPLQISALSIREN